MYPVGSADDDCIVYEMQIQIDKGILQIGVAYVGRDDCFAEGVCLLPTMEALGEDNDEAYK
jgi:hypothetical protein